MKLPRWLLAAAPWLLVAAFLAVNTALLLHGGIRQGADSTRYLKGADLLLQGRPFVEKEANYLGYVAVVAFSKWSGIGLPGLIAIQLGAAALAALALWDLGRQLSGPIGGLLAAGLLVANPDLARWHWYVLTDSLYTSAVILAVWGIHQAGSRGKVGYGLAFGLILAAALVRPNGWVLLPLAVLYGIATTAPRQPFRSLAISGVLVAFLTGAAAIPVFRNGVQRESPEVMLRRGEVVWGYAAGRWRMPQDPSSPEAGWTAGLSYVLRHPAACLRLAAARVATELLHTRPFYSARHNVAVLVFLLPLYALAVVGLIRTWKRPLARLTAGVIAAHLLVVALTFADWDGRFLLYVLPLVGLLAASGACCVARGLYHRLSPAVQAAC